MDKKVFGNRYQITERIGLGGMAEVFKASDTTLGRTVALKVMLPQYAADHTFAARFRQEAQAAANLTSPYIVNIYDWGRDDDMYYIIMEYVRGTDLKTAVQERGSIHPRKVAEIGSQVCSALSVAHSYGIIHRDIKSANIMVQTDGNAKVMDFGIAQAGNSDMTQDSNVLGTAHYVSPEQAQGKPLTGASDLYSLGVVMYEAATGQLPFDGPDAVSVAMKQVSEEPVPPRAINSSIDPALEAIILKAMAKNTAERYATANEMKQALDDYLAGRNASAAATTVIGAAAATPVLDSTRVIDPVEAGSDVAGAVNDSYNNHGGHDSGKKGKKKAPVKLIIGILVVLIVAAIAGVTLLNGGTKAEQVIVPSVVDKTVEEATQVLGEYGLDVGSISYQASETVDQGKVISQSPDANSSADKGGKVDLVVSSGKDQTEVAVPNLIGLTEAQAKEALTSAGFVPQKSGEGNSNDQAAGNVYDQSPNAMEQAPKGSTVTYRVSLGKADTNVKVENYTGQNADTVRAKLENAGLVVKTKEGTSDSVSVGDVCGQDIPAGTSVGAGTTITLTVCTGTSNVTVPNALGMTESKATSTLKNAGFKVSKEYSEGEDGKVIDQTPSSGSAKRGSTVTIIIGTGVDDSTEQ